MKQMINRSASVLLSLLMICSAVFAAAPSAAADTLTAKTITVSLEEGKGNAHNNLIKLQEALGSADKKTALTVKIAAKGTYYVGHPTGGGGLALRSNTTLDLNGSALMRSGNMYNLIQNVDDNGDRNAGGYSLSSHIAVLNGTVDGTGGNSDEVNLVNLGHADGITIKNVKFQNCRDGHMIELSGCRNAVISGCTFDGYIGPAKEANEAVQLDISYSDRYNPWNGAYFSDKTPCKNIKVDGCTFYDYPSGVGNHHTAAKNHNSDITITNNKFYNQLKTSQPAIWCYGFDNCVVSGNVVSGNYETGIAVSGGSVEVTNNTVTGVSYMPANITVSNSYLLDGTAKSVEEPVTGGLVTGNKFSTTGAEALAVYHGTKLSTISNNTIRSAGSTAMIISGDVTVDTVKNNDIYSSADCGIWAASGTVIKTISDNTVYGKVKALNLTSGAKITTVTNNKLSAVSDSGLYASSSSCSTIKNNVITCSSGCGFWAASDSRIGAVSDNTISGKTKCVNLTSGTKVTSIINNQLSSAGECLYVSSGSCGSIRKNVINSSANYGLWAASKSKIDAVSDNTILGKSNAVYVTSDAKITDLLYNTISSSKESGVCVTGSSCINIVGNTVSNCGSNGIHIASAGKVERIQLNRLSKCKGYGFVIYNDGITVAVGENTFSSNTDGTYYSKAPTKKSSKFERTDLDAPVISKLANENNGVRIGWKAVNGASKYRVLIKKNNSWKKLCDTKATSALDKSVKSGVTYTYTVRCITADGSKYAGAYDTKGKSIVYVAPPVVKSVSCVAGGLKVTWGKVSGAASYRVFRQNNKGAWVKLGDTVAVSLTDKKVSSGTSYIYTVRCMDKKGNYTSGFNTKGRKGIYYAMPVISKAVNTNKGIQLSWNKVKGASKYRVFIKNKSNKWAKLGDTTAVTMVDKSVKSGTAYTYTVRAMNSKGGFVGSYDTKGCRQTYVAAPQFSLGNVYNGVKISWKAVKGASKYRVFIKSGSSWKKLADTAGTSTVDTKVNDGKAYTYTVRCLNAAGTAYTSDTPAGKKTVCYLPPVLHLNNAEDSVHITWSRVGSAAKYRVFVKNSSGAWVKLGDTAGMSMDDRTAASGSVHSYTIRTMDSKGNYLSAYDPNGVSITFLKAPEFTVANAADGVAISWNAVKGAAKYRVYLQSGDGWTALTDTKETSFKHHDTVSGTSYTYTVRCINAAGTVCTSSFRAGKSIVFYSSPVLTLTSVENGVSIAWNETAGAAGYRVFCKDAEGKWQSLTDVEAAAYTHTGVVDGTAYTYAVCVLSANGECVSSLDEEGYTIIYEAPQPVEPTEEPTEAPTAEPSEPAENPTENPTEEPTEQPTQEPTDSPAPAPTELYELPIVAPAAEPTAGSEG